ncbi:MAG: Ppx/GppA phosphatase family protein [Alphaproteobacteria bacterium]
MNKAALKEPRYGVIDIGSNSIRLVVYQGPKRAPTPFFNEKVLCGLGRSLAATGSLDADGLALALHNLPRFAALAREMGVEGLHVVATAAVREARDGAEFVAVVKKLCGLEMRILDGDEEARLAASGVIAGYPRARGIMGDLGGGSLELVTLRQAGKQKRVTLPLGSFRLNEARGAGRSLERFIAESLARLDWIDLAGGEALHAVGGAWRTLARIHMSQSGYPLRVIDRYSVSREDMADVVRLIGGLGQKSLERLPGVPARRLEALSAAALLMDGLLDAVRPGEVLFSAHGLREGLLYDALSDEEKAQDPLVAAAHGLASRFGRFTGLAKAFVEWTGALFEDETEADRRLREVACIIGDTGWSEHPSYRADYGFERALRFSVSGVSHPGRAFLAMAISVRYLGVETPGRRRFALDIGLEPARVDAAVSLGLALRLAISFCGGNPAVLTGSPLRLEPGKLVLVMGPMGREMLGETVERRLSDLAAQIGRTSRIENAGDKAAGVS